MDLCNGMVLNFLELIVVNYSMIGFLAEFVILDFLSLLFLFGMLKKDIDFNKT